MMQIFLSMAYTFLIVSYLASAGSEGLASLFKWRAHMLYRGVQALLNDSRTHLARAVYANALVNPQGPGEKLAVSGFGIRSTLPSYIDSKCFAIALLQTLGLTDPNAFIMKPPEEIQRFVAEKIPALKDDPSLQNLLCNFIIKNGGDLEGISKSIAVWFESSTDRITGAYKRRTQLSTFLIALVMAVVFDINPLPPALILPTHADPATVAAMVGAAPPGTPAGAPVADSPRAAPLPVLRAPAVPPSVALPATKPGAGDTSAAGSAATAGRSAPVVAVGKVFGWLLTAISALLGAPFWFDILSKIASVKGAGPTPAPGPAASPASAGQPPGPIPTATPPGGTPPTAPPGGAPIAASAGGPSAA